MFPGSNIARTIARCGFDWITVDAEHGNIDDAAMHEAVTAIAGCGVSPLVRVAANEGWMFKRALDAGAHGIIVPLLKTEADARQVVDGCKFPPQGARGFGSPFPMGSFNKGLTQTEYLQQANESLVTIVQIETKEALANIKEIAAVPGIDVLFIGPFDLGNNIGHPIQGSMAPDLKEAIATILRTANEAGKAAGIYATSGEQARAYAQQGFHLISAATDVPSLSASMSEALKQAAGR